MTLKIISQSTNVCGIEYVDVKTDRGIHTMLKSKVELVTALAATGLSALGISAVMSLVEKYAQDLEREKTL